MSVYLSCLKLFVITVFVTVIIGQGKLSAKTILPIEIGQKISVKVNDEGAFYRYGQFEGYENDKVLISNNIETVITRIVTHDDLSYRFDSFDGGVGYNPRTQSVTGFTWMGEGVTLFLSEIKYAKVNTYVNYKKISKKYDSKKLQEIFSFEALNQYRVWQLPVDSLESIKKWDKPSHKGRIKITGGIIGFGTGFLLGKVITKSVDNERQNKRMFQLFNGSPYVVIIPSALFGTLVGYEIAKAIANKYTWRTVGVKIHKVSMQPLLNKKMTGLALVVGF